MFFMEKYGYLSLNYPCYPFLSGAQLKCTCKQNFQTAINSESSVFYQINYYKTSFYKYVFLTMHNMWVEFD